MKIKYAKIALLVIMLLCISTPLGGCASTSRCSKSWDSNMQGGLERKVTVYAYDGTVIKTWEGKIDISEESDSEVLFDLNGKRIIITNGIVITEEL